MPSDVKAIVSLVTLLVGVGFAYWEGVNGNGRLIWLVIGLAVFAVVAMWVFPEAQGGKPQSDDSGKPT